MKYFYYLLFGLSYSLAASAELDATAFWYEEKETGTDVSQVRYLLTDQYIRIDEGRVENDYILYDDRLQQILSVNHADQTILVIENSDWKKPAFSFQQSTRMKVLENAPRVAGKKVNSYQLLADDRVCTDIQYLPGLFTEQMKLFKNYQRILSAQQVRSLNNTPLAMQTPCFLLDQIYNEADYFDLGLPIQMWHARGYAKILKSYNEVKVPAELFSLPQGYTRYYPYNRASQTPSD